MGVAPERPELTARKKIKAGRLRLQKSEERQKLAVVLDMNISLFLDHLFVCFHSKCNYRGTILQIEARDRWPP